MGLKKHGITSETIKNMILGAGVIYKNLKYEKPSNGWTGTPLGATSGGLKFNYEAQWLDVEVDGATVLIKGVSKQKVGESATLEGQMTELTEDILVSALHLVKSTSEDTTYVKYVSKFKLKQFVVMVKDFAKKDDLMDFFEGVAELVGTEQNDSMNAATVDMVTPTAI